MHTIQSALNCLYWVVSNPDGWSALGCDTSSLGPSWKGDPRHGAPGSTPFLGCAHQPSQARTILCLSRTSLLRSRVTQTAGRSYASYLQPSAWSSHSALWAGWPQIQAMYKTIITASFLYPLHSPASNSVKAIVQSKPKRSTSRLHLSGTILCLLVEQHHIWDICLGHGFSCSYQSLTFFAHLLVFSLAKGWPIHR